MKRFISLLLAIYMVLLTMPLSANAASSQKAMFLFKKTLYVTCNVSSHAYKASYPDRKPIDIIDNVSGNGNAYAPFDCKVVSKSTSNGNTVAFESLNKVYFADGTYDYMTFMVSHDNDISNLNVGNTFKQGDIIYQEGNTGTSSGTHIHLEVAKGAYSKRSSSSQSIWSFVRNKSNVKYPHDAFFLYPGTKISKSGGYSWTYANEYTITYNANGGSGAPGKQTVAAGDWCAVSSTKPTHTGYTFLGWSKSSTATSASYTSGDIFFNETSNITLYAVWRKNTLKVYYNANGGSISSDDYKLSSNIIYKKSDSTKYYQSWTYNSTKSNGLLNASTFGIYKTGYSFAGWGISSSGGTIFDSNDTSIVPTDLTSSIKNGDCSITLYAQWKKSTYTLTYNANGGSNPPSAQSGSTSYTISSTKPTKSGYTFLGWSKSSSATSASFTAGDKITLTSNTTLYAVWSKNTCTISFVLEEGTTYTSKTITKGNSIGSLPTPTKSGYEFVGWDTQSNTSLARVTASSTFSSDTKLYAKWSDTYYGNKITFVLNGGYISENTASCKFDGINISRGDGDTILFNCNGKVSPANQWGVEIAVNSDGKVTAKRSYGDETALTVPAGGFILSAHLPIEGNNAGCKFIDETSVGDYVYYNKNTMTAYRCTSQDICLFYAKYVKSNNAIGLLPSPTKSGYKFVGWDTSNTSSVARVTTSTIISSNTTLYAVWEKIPVAEVPIPTIKIRNNPNTTTIKYGDILQLTAETTNMPEGAYVAWYYNGTEGAFEYGKSDDSLTCMILSLDDGSTKITAVVVEQNGNPILDAEGNEISDSQTIKSKAGFWQILVSLFKSLFGISRIIVQSINKFI